MVVKVTNVALWTLFQQVVAIAIAAVEPADLPPVMLVLLMMALTVGKSQAQTCSG